MDNFYSNPIDNSLDEEAMPEGKNWMSIAPEVVSHLSQYEMHGVLQHLAGGGQTEVRAFYSALARFLSTERALEVIELAKTTE